MNLSEADKTYLWHPFTQQARWAAQDPLIIERGQGCYLIDTDGKRYLDGVSSLWVNVHGHRCDEIDQAVRDQLDKIAHTTLLGLGNVPSIELAAELVSVVPSNLKRVFYSDSGSTAVEIALKMAFQYWQLMDRPNKRRFVALDQAYHGDTIGAVSVGGIDLFHQIFGPLLFETLRAPTPQTDPDRALNQLEQLLQNNHSDIAALIIEPCMQGAAGMLVQPHGYLTAVAQLCRRYEVLLIADEVATGFGRTGYWFACDSEQVQPDLMAVAKGITGGYLPLAATLASEAIYAAFWGDRQKTFFHGHTYTGNPLACAAALASIRRMKRLDLISQVRARAEQLQQRLREKIAPIKQVSDIRQRGLMVGIELTSDDPLLGVRVCEAVRNHGVILRPLGNVIVLMPPLVISENEVTILVDATARGMKDCQ